MTENSLMASSQYQDKVNTGQCRTVGYLSKNFMKRHTDPPTHFQPDVLSSSNITMPMKSQEEKEDKTMKDC